MNRREFITTCAAGAAIAATSLPLMADDAKPPLPDYRKFLPLRSRVPIPDWAQSQRLSRGIKHGKAKMQPSHFQSSRMSIPICVIFPKIYRSPIPKCTHCLRN